MVFTLICCLWLLRFALTVQLCKLIQCWTEVLESSPCFKFQAQVTGDVLPWLEKLVSTLFSYNIVTVSVIRMYKGSLIINDKCHFSFKIKIKLLIKLFFLVAKKFGLKKILNYKLHTIILTKIKYSTQKKPQAKYISVIISSKKYFTMEKSYDNFFS